MLTFRQKLLSHFFPVSIRKGATAHNAQLEIFYYRGRFILATADAVYSDGHKYKPLVAAFSAPPLKQRSPAPCIYWKAWDIVLIIRW